ncbi:DUF4389 domain-containing protein [Marinospirillum perlucidum]|uniref:DUF4389 domain-containing protein n=1 Tax=Marinospirillum perlucidum TaxID=1982602 RepID=UPI000DF229E7|nr:DUF4389 domain-containing protein [Marinospirillum perlucidum]
MAKQPSLKARLQDESFWLRLPFVFLFFLAWKLTELIIIGLVLVQLVYRLFVGQPQPQLLALGSQLSRYAYQVFRYVTFNSDEKPFPFADWPATEAMDADPYQPQDSSEETDAEDGDQEQRVK